MTISIREVHSKKELKQFIRFPFSLYKNCQEYVPPIINFELSTLLREKNPAFDHCDAKYWVAERDGEIVGRIAGIVHNQELKDKKMARFGWIDFIDDKKVSKSLIDTVCNWGQSKGANQLHGPLGFTDLDFEGSLISGFDQMATQGTIYNYPYYHTHYEELAFEKAIDWEEVRAFIPNEMPMRMARTASFVESRFGIHVKKFKRNKEMIKYAPDVFRVLNETYSQLYGYYPLTKNQIDYYVKLYFGFIRRDFVSLVLNKEENVVAMAISLPSLSKAFKKAKGSLFPLGFLHVLRDFRKNEHIDLFLIAVSPEYQKLGASAILFNDLMSNYIKKGVKYVSTGPMLEENQAVLNLWNEFGDQMDNVNIRRRCYVKEIKMIDQI